MAKTLAELRWGVRANLREKALNLDAKTGTVTVASTTAVTVTGSGTLFLTEYQVGDEIQVAGVIRTVRSIASNLALTVHKAFGAASSAVAHYNVVRQGGWSDEEIDDELETARAVLEARIWREAPRALDGVVKANVVAGADTVTLPTGLLSFVVAEYRANSSEAYVPIPRLDVLLKDRGAAWPWPFSGGAAQKPTARPSAYTVISPTVVELDTYPDVSVTEGLRFYGPQRLSVLDDDADTLGLPEPTTWENVLMLMATERLLRMEQSEAVRAQTYAKMAEDAFRVAAAPWQAGGRDSSVQNVVLVE
jgi:hypothetical protein